jgi:hypothetical protein
MHNIGLDFFLHMEYELMQEFQHQYLSLFNVVIVGTTFDRKEYLLWPL